MTDLKATIFDIQRSSFHDGPGIRTTVFFKGCNLACAWCHNPESQSFLKETLNFPDKTTPCGRDYTADEVFETVLRDELFYEASGGGVTFSGGECMLQLDFLLEILKKCKEHGLHTAVDTAGNVPWESFEKVLPFTDLFLYDIKTMDDSLHKKYTGVGNGLILENLSRLFKSGAKIWIRIPVICGINDSEEEMQKICTFLNAIGIPEAVELLPYHALGEGKAR
ncbi:MAG: glycyl-radical enzyme activating protein, partial [Oscillospiraceae bacterium]|nr:glycyl-radical enzyme activating protein [Oscillospiraceae bacterium]